uniref:Ribonuclease H protein At1g65750 family n=1 Tax=Cajanus cajan TaxID=3821 RepID=A0A151TQV2_CAJCA|nr:Putative ribonuclease H protein At1g65750 family [Cajanus cajan]
MVSRSPSTRNVVKVNTDGSLVGNPGISGFGKLLRDLYGAWLRRFSDSCDITINMKTKLLGMYRGTRLVWETGSKKVIYELDSLMALKLVTKNISP